MSTIIDTEIRKIVFVQCPFSLMQVKNQNKRFGVWEKFGFDSFCTFSYSPKIRLFFFQLGCEKLNLYVYCLLLA